MNKQVKWLLIVLILILLLLQYKLWFASGGIFDMFKVKKQAQQQGQKVEKLEKRNNALVRKVKGLKDGDTDVAKHAREDLGLVNQGEEYVQVVEQSQLDKEKNENSSQ